jgi:hypothetical protein
MINVCSSWTSHAYVIKIYDSLMASNWLVIIYFHLVGLMFILQHVILVVLLRPVGHVHAYYRSVMFLLGFFNFIEKRNSVDVHVVVWKFRAI